MKLLALLFSLAVIAAGWGQSALNSRHESIRLHTTAAESCERIGEWDCAFVNWDAAWSLAQDGVYGWLVDDETILRYRANADDNAIKHVMTVLTSEPNRTPASIPALDYLLVAQPANPRLQQLTDELADLDRYNRLRDVTEPTPCQYGPIYARYASGLMWTLVQDSDAQVYYDRIEFSGNGSYADFLFAGIRDRQCDRRGCLENIEEAMQGASSRMDSALANGLILVGSQRYSDGLWFFREINYTGPSGSDKYFGMAIAHLGMGHTIMAYRCADSAVVLDRYSSPWKRRLREVLGEELRSQESIIPALVDRVYWPENGVAPWGPMLAYEGTL